MIGKVKLLRTLKAGENVWDEGKLFEHPNIPPDILSEALRGSEFVEVTERKDDHIPIEVSDDEHVTRVGSVVTDNFFDESKFSPKSPSLLKRKRRVLRKIKR